MLSGIALAQILAGERHAPIVYFLRVADRVKIGTTTNLKRRMESLSFSLQYVMLAMPGGVETEATLHEAFAECRIHDDREWFAFQGPLRDFLEGMTDAPERPWFPRKLGKSRPRRRDVLSALPADRTGKLWTLRRACSDGLIPLEYEAARKARARTGTLTPSGRVGNADAYSEADLTAWYQRHYGPPDGTP